MRAAPALVLCVAAAVVSGFSRTTAASRFEFNQPQMGTTARVVLYTDDAQKARHHADRAFARIAEIDSRLSDYRPDSELMTLCRAAGGPVVAVSQDLFTVLAAAQDISRRTEGAFDVTIGPLSRLWRRAHVTGEPPDPAKVAAARGRVGYEHVQLSPPRNVRLTQAGMLLDLGGIAKGYAADEALRLLRLAGVSRALVALGGDIAAGDAPPGKEGWTVAIAPLGPETRIPTPPLTLRHGAVSTSGDAEQYIEIEGTRYSHIVTPRTGRALEGRRGVTVRAADSMNADALATALSVLGLARGLALIDATPRAAALIVEYTATGIREYRSHGW